MEDEMERMLEALVAWITLAGLGEAFIMGYAPPILTAASLIAWCLAIVCLLIILMLSLLVRYLEPGAEQ